MSNKEIPKAQRASPKTLQDWLDTMPSRDEAIVAAHRHSQLSLSEMARAQESQTSDRTAGAAQ